MRRRKKPYPQSYPPHDQTDHPESVGPTEVGPGSNTFDPYENNVTGPLWGLIMIDPSCG